MQLPRSKFRAALAFAPVACLLVGVLFFQHKGWARFTGEVNALSLNLERPDGLIVTQSLSRLPRDLLKIPLLKDLLTDDLVFYYEHNEGYLSLSGSLRRISFEHDLQWNDRLLETVLDAPAEVAFWRDGKNTAEYTLIAMTRNNLAKVLQQAAMAALKDPQLTLATHLTVDGEVIPVLALSYGRDRNLLVAAHGDRMVVLSHPDMLLSEPDKASPAAAAVVVRLLSSKGDAHQVYQRALEVPATPVVHEVVVSTDFLSFGYQHFFPGLAALRFEFNQEAWTMHARLATPGASALAVPAALTALPTRPAACAALPVDWQRLSVLSAPAGKMPQPPRFAGPVAACWYAGAELDTPVFAAELAQAPDGASDKALEAVFRWAVSGKDAKPEAQPADTHLWQRRSQTLHAPAQKGGGHYYLTSLARKNRFVVFSPDAALVRRSLSTIDHRYPSVADGLPPDPVGTTVAVLTPKVLGMLSFEAITGVLQQASLRDAANTQLSTRIKSLDRYPAYQLTVAAAPEQTGNWHAVRWTPLPERP